MTTIGVPPTQVFGGTVAGSSATSSGRREARIVPELIDYNRVARQYQSGRGLSQNTLDAWRLAVSEFVPERS